MSTPSLRKMFAAAIVLCSLVEPGNAQPRHEQAPKVEIGFIEVDAHITPRRMVAHNTKPKGTVLFLHGFPETLYAWKDISLALAEDYEVHAIDWPGYGLSSRPTADRFSYAPRVKAQFTVLAGIGHYPHLQNPRLAIDEVRASFR